MTRRAPARDHDRAAARDPQDARALLASPPHSEDAEQAVLAAAMLPGDEGRAALAAARAVVAPADFYRDGHGVLFRAACELADAGTAVDPLTLAAHLERAGALRHAGGREYLAFLTDAVPHGRHAGDHAAIVARWAVKRRLWATCLEGAAAAADPATEPAACAAQTAEALRPAAAAGRQGGFRPARELALDAMEEFERRVALARSGQMVGLPLGYPEMDEACGGTEPGDLVTLLLVSGHGKTALQMGMVRALAADGYTVGIVSAEMQWLQLTWRLAAGEAGVPFWRIRKGLVSDEEFARVTRAHVAVGRWPVFVDDAPLPHVDQVTARVRALKADHPSLTHVVVDYAQLLSDDAELRAEQLDRIPAKLKAVAKELDVVAVESAQPDGKTVDRRAGDHMPLLADVAWGQGVRNASDTVICGYRPGMYAPIPDDHALFRVEKSRASGRAEFRLGWHGETMDYRSARRSYGLDHLSLVSDAAGPAVPHPDVRIEPRAAQPDLYPQEPAA